MPEQIYDLNLVIADALTPAQLHGLIRKIDLQIVNLLTVGGIFGAVDAEENGDNTSHKSSPSTLLRELRELRRQYVADLSNPAVTDDPIYIVSNVGDAIVNQCQQ